MGFLQGQDINPPLKSNPEEKDFCVRAIRPLRCLQ